MKAIIWVEEERSVEWFEMAQLRNEESFLQLVSIPAMQTKTIRLISNLRRTANPRFSFLILTIDQMQTEVEIFFQMLFH